MKKIFLLVIVLLFGCDQSSLKNNQSRIVESSEATKRVQEIVKTNYNISAELLYESFVVDDSLGQFNYLDTSITGIDFVHNWNPKPRHKDQLNNSFIAAGVAVGDIDNDGLSDVFLSRQSDGGRLYKNLGGFRFEDITIKSGIIPEGMWSTGATFVDINNDGFLDLFVCGFDSPNRLYINRKGRFEESAGEYGLDYKGASVVMSFSDFDLDGDLDAYLLTNRLESTDATAKAKIINDKNRPLQVHPDSRELGYFVRPPGRLPILVNAGQYDYLFRNDNGIFVDVTIESGIGKNPYYGLSSTWWDYNDDGWPDLYVANDYMGPDHLFRNEGIDSSGAVRFVDVVDQALPHTPWFSMGSDYSDINNDGRFDFLATDMAGSNHYRDKVSMGSMSGSDSEAWFLNFPNPPQYMRNTVYLNTGTERFMEVAYLTGLAATDWTWTVKF
ncbi:MAG: VCBS repeat-containing protein, partial [Candidatus Neomarinimicrobiota bacterium]|nr:VCBS repeat-containing protein [Candidatus Neomarinimicrobiota bacterium]